MEIHLDGERVEVPAGARLGDLLPGRAGRCSVAVIRPAIEEDAAESQEVRFVTSAGDSVAEIAEPAMVSRLFRPGLSEHLRLHWQDRHAAAFGPFKSDIRPAREPGRYERGDVILGCGGYEPSRSYLIFARMRHTADYGAPAGGGVIGRVVTGRGLLDRIVEGDRIVEVERIFRRADRSHAVITRDAGFPLEDGMQVISYVEADVEGFRGEGIDIRTARSVEHFLLAVQNGRFPVDRSSSTYIADTHLVPTKVPADLPGPRLEGTITVRTAGKSSGAVYIYTQGVSASPVHTVVGRVRHGLELVRFAGEGDLLAIRAEPERFDLVGLDLGEAEAVAARRGITLTADAAEGDRVVVGQTPATTLEVLAAGAVKVTTEPSAHVISITLDEAAAPRSVTIFREVTGLKHHAVGKMPLVFTFEDVFLFKPKIGKGVGIIPENTPTGEVPAFTLAMTNDSRRGAGMVGVRTTPNAEFGPTSEPLTGTNVIGNVLDAGNLAGMREGATVYVREVK
ncbi:MULTISPECIES: methanogenesis marker 3 protein [unclassified Methanoculleus]|uniref:methyl-coenzyme M reductase-associated protein Mmp3 n=1 Tax=unclassified Methanoculleus TaxID=2619537 RepID=UPI0025F407BB|nr:MULTISPECIES: methanogenesis marker 3 protein [unclassified Methanoculleus]MCK9317627.1 methanogenesis marker 3 protein [Methanoculleus sp.]MDD2253511.1 methanogenesis marker 3 protein [Methanoculleus sp.]MDD2788365.1 methanogenesis marker 3 protein [Methanoculleus sp.]MDD3215667.1 methanogenesis marker 3 protein [Methanoculleus sp.]MDD4313413.1 methanogenesis marker 3 protein [Methanoculleus sp.]